MGLLKTGATGRGGSAPGRSAHSGCIWKWQGMQSEPLPVRILAQRRQLAFSEPIQSQGEKQQRRETEAKLTVRVTDCTQPISSTQTRMPTCTQAHIPKDLTGLEAHSRSYRASIYTLLTMELHSKCDVIRTHSDATNCNLQSKMQEMVGLLTPKLRVETDMESSLRSSTMPPWGHKDYQGTAEN